MGQELKGKKVAILVTHGFEQVELTDPKKALEEAGAQAKIIAPEAGEVQGWQHTEWGDKFSVDLTLDRAAAEDFDALLLPGGVMSPDKLRMNSKAVDFVRTFLDAGKPIAAICHGPWTLLEAGAARGRKMTSYPSLKTDLQNAGAQWLDQEVVVDGGIVTSRSPKDLPPFNTKMIEEFGEGIHSR